jgi:hypothetical protein
LNRLALPSRRRDPHTCVAAAVRLCDWPRARPQRKKPLAEAAA